MPTPHCILPCILLAATSDAQLLLGEHAAVAKFRSNDTTPRFSADRFAYTPPVSYSPPFAFPAVKVVLLETQARKCTTDGGGEETCRQNTATLAWNRISCNCCS